MSTNIIFSVPGRTTNYMPVDVNTPKDALLEKYARESYSTENTWPYESPSAGYYDITNSDTKLILLNKRVTWSHLRGKTKPKREPFIKDEYYDWVEKEIEMKAQNEKNATASRDNSATKRTADPSRHFSAIGCTFKPSFDDDSLNSLNFKSNNKNLSKSLYNWSRPRTSVTETKKKSELKKQEQDELLNYFYQMSTRKAGLSDKTHVKNPPAEYLSSYNINHPELKKGQKMFLNNLCQVYSVTPLKKSKQTQYISLLEKQKRIDKFSRDKFRMHDGENFAMYQEFIKTERPVPNQINCGHFHPRQVKTANADSRSSSRKVFVSRKKSYITDFDSSSKTSTSSSQSTLNKLTDDSNYTIESESSDIKYDEFVVLCQEKSKGKVLSDLSNTDYESSSTVSKSSVTTKSSSETLSDKESEHSRSMSKISNISDGFDTKSSSSIETQRKPPKIEISATSLESKESDEDSDSTLTESSSSRSSSPSSTARSEFMNTSREQPVKAKTPSKPVIKNTKPIKIVQKSEDEE